MQVETYFLNKRWRPSLLAIGIAGIIFFVFLALIIYFRNELTLLDMLCFVPFILMPFELLYEGLNSKVELTDVGIIYYQPRFTLFCNWENLTDITFGTTEFTLVFSSAQILHGKWLVNLLKWLGPWDRMVPFSPYISPKNAKQLKEIVLSNATHLPLDAREFLEYRMK